MSLGSDPRSSSTGYVIMRGQSHLRHKEHCSVQCHKVLNNILEANRLESMRESLRRELEGRAREREGGREIGREREREVGGERERHCSSNVMCWRHMAWRNCILRKTYTSFLLLEDLPLLQSNCSRASYDKSGDEKVCVRDHSCIIPYNQLTLNGFCHFMEACSLTWMQFSSSLTDPDKSLNVLEVLKQQILRVTSSWIMNAFAI